MAANKAKEEAEQDAGETVEEYEERMWYFNSLLSNGIAPVLKCFAKPGQEVFFRPVSWKNDFVDENWPVLLLSG